MTEFIFSYDTEDYVDPAAADSILRSAEILRAEDVRGCFCFVARLAEALQKWGRQDVIDALKYHEIGTHSLAHSYHPNINEYTDRADYEEARERFLREEGEAHDILCRVFEKDRIFGAVPPGNCVSYVAHYGYPDLGIPVYAGDVYFRDEGRTRPVVYCNGLNVYYNENMEIPFLPDENGSRMSDDDLRAMLDKAAQNDHVVFYNHPHMCMYKMHWDDVNFFGKNTPESEWQEPERLSQEATDQYFETFARLVRMVKADPRFQIVTYETIAQRYLLPRKLTRAMLPGLRKQIAEDFFPVTLPDSYCLSDILAACRAFLADDDCNAFSCGKVYGFLEEPFASSSPVTVTAAEMKQSASSLDLSGFLPDSIEVGGKKLGPADWLRAALDVLCGSEQVTVQPGDWQIDLKGQFPHFYTMNLTHTWVNPNWTDENLARRCRMQSWTIRLPQGSSRKIF